MARTWTPEARASRSRKREGRKAVTIRVADSPLGKRLAMFALVKLLSEDELETLIHFAHSHAAFLRRRAAAKKEE